MNIEDHNTPLITRDWLAIECKFLAYFRTFILFLGIGITILKLEFFF